MNDWKGKRMKITSIEPVVVKVNHRGDWVFVHVKTDEGIVGLGEASHGGEDSLVLAAIAHFATMLQGEDASKIETIRKRLSRPSVGRIGHTALSAIEQALWDALGQKLGVPVHVLLGGGMRERLRLLECCSTAHLKKQVHLATVLGFVVEPVDNPICDCC